MLKFYYHPLSPIARRVWIALLEKEIPFEAVLVDLRGEQFEADFLLLNPFHHVPALVHDDLRLIESMAILDYLELQFPQVSLSPDTPGAIAQMRMVQMVVTNELLPKLVAVVIADEENPLPEKTTDHLEICLRFLTKQLGDKDYFGGDALNLADAVAGATVPLFNRLGVSLRAYESLQQWQDRITSRSAWQLTKPSDSDFQLWQRWIRLQVQRAKQNRQR
ncbi:MAG: glutathione S-transferase family protein [Phormidesmis sp.]